MGNFTVHQEGRNVQLIVNGRLVLETNWQGALDIAQAIRSVAKQAEEFDQHTQIAYDNAILLRAGIGVGLTNHPDIQAESLDLALYDRNLRRFMPGGVKGTSIVGTPTVTQTKGDEHGEDNG